MNHGKLFLNDKNAKFTKKQIKDLTPWEIYLIGRRDMLCDIIENRVGKNGRRYKNA
jgi:hypothetical protein